LIVCVLVVDNTFDEFEVEICCQRTDGVDSAFSTDKDLGWLRAERPSESTLAYSAETLFFSIIWSCLYYVGEPVSVRGGLLSKEHVEAIISSVRLDARARRDCIWDATRGRFWAGYGQRSTRQAAHEVATFFGQEVTALELVSPRFYHFDVCTTHR
jgi:hypothetical protein